MREMFLTCWVLKIFDQICLKSVHKIKFEHETPWSRTDDGDENSADASSLKRKLISSWTPLLREQNPDTSKHQNARGFKKKPFEVKVRHCFRCHYSSAVYCWNLDVSTPWSPAVTLTWPGRPVHEVWHGASGSRHKLKCFITVTETRMYFGKKHMRHSLTTEQKNFNLQQFITSCFLISDHRDPVINVDSFVQVVQMKLLMEERKNSVDHPRHQDALLMSLKRL